MSSEAEPKNPTEVQAPVESIDTFLGKIARAKVEGTPWIETSDSMISYFNRRGLNNSKYFIYDGIKVAPFGMSETIDEECENHLSTMTFGKNEGIVDGRG